MPDRIEIELAFRSEPEEEIKLILGETGANQIEGRSQLGLTGIETVLVCFLLITQTVKLVERLARFFKTGVVVAVSADGGKVSIEKNADIPRGSVLLVRPDRTQVTLEEPTEMQLESWFKDVFKAVWGAH